MCVRSAGFHFKTTEMTREHCCAAHQPHPSVSSMVWICTDMEGAIFWVLASAEADLESSNDLKLLLAVGELWKVLSG